MVKDGNVKTHIVIKNNEGKKWIVPLQDLKIGMLIYQPGGYKGKIIKNVIPLFPKAFLRKIFQCVNIDEFLPAEIFDLICSKYGDDVVISKFDGNPSVQGKPTIQISTRKELIGYLKYTNRGEVYQHFENEKKMLDFLKQRKVDGVPECIILRKSTTSLYVFSQTTKKTLFSKTVYEFGNYQTSFLQDLARKTEVVLPFEQTDFFRVLNELKTIFENSKDDKIRDVVLDACINTISFYERKIVKFGVSHRDFTPWNTCVDNGKLFVFDWEYSKYSYPHHIDKIKFIAESKKFSKRISIHEVIKNIIDYEDSQEIIDYLLDNIYLYSSRNEPGDYNYVLQYVSALQEVKVNENCSNNIKLQQSQ